MPQQVEAIPTSGTRAIVMATATLDRNLLIQSADMVLDMGHQLIHGDLLSWEHCSLLLRIAKECDRIPSCHDPLVPSHYRRMHEWVGVIDPAKDDQRKAIDYALDLLRAAAK